MGIELAEARRIADLARLELDAATLERYRDQLQQILDYVARLERLVLVGTPAGRAELVQPTGPEEDGGPAAAHPTRADEPVGSLTNDEALANAPDGREGFFCVPHVLGKRS